MKDYYTVLDLNDNATDDQIRTQYRQLVRIYHPDRFSNPVDKLYAENKLQEINEAYYGLLAPERTGKGPNRRLAQSQDKFPLLSATPGSVMILLSVLFVGVFLGGIDYETLINDDPARANSSFVERLAESWRGGSDSIASGMPLHNWLSFSVFENYRNVLYIVGDDGQPQMDIPLAGYGQVWSPARNQLAFLSPERDGTQIYTASTVPTIGGQARQRNNEAAGAGQRRGQNAGQGGSELSRITQDNDIKEQLTWSPDGLRLAYIAKTSEAEMPVLKLADLETNQITLLTSPRMGAVRHAVWLDEANLLVNVEQDGSSQIYQVPVDGKAASLFVNFASRDPSVAPSGQRIVLASDEGLFALLRNGNDVSQLTATPAWKPNWSPNGGKIAYLAAPLNAENLHDSKRTALWVVDASGQNQERITEEGTLSFAWSVDGEALAYVTGNLQTQPPTLYLWTVPLGGSAKLIAEISEPHITWGRGQ